MKAKTRFLKMYYKLPEKAKMELIIYFDKRPYSMNVIASEVRSDTRLSKAFLLNLGYEVREVDEHGKIS